LLDALEIESATVVGSSMGGFFTLSAALDHPRRVRKIVLVGYPVGLIKSAPFPLKIIGGVPGLSRRFMKGRPSVEAQRDQYRTMFHVDPDTVPELFFETRIAGLQLPSEENTWADLLPRVVGLGGVRKDVYLGDEIGRIEAPALMIMGEHDMAPPQAGQAAMTRFRKGRFEYLPGIGHFPYLEAPQRTAELILEFVRE
jgi:pimeloyl-ACP methyl ester carboxylesterase